MWTIRIIVTIFAFYEVGVTDTLSTGYLVLGSITGGPSYNRTKVYALPIETAAGNTTIHTTPEKSFFFNNFLEQPMAIDVDYARKQLYIYNRYSATLQKLNFYPENGFQNDIAIPLHQGLSRSNVKIAFDWISNNIYWTDPAFRWIALQSLNTYGHYRILVYDNVERPTGIAVDPTHKYLFWSDVGSLPKIERSSLSGTGRKTILSQGIAYPIALDVDIASSKLYWVDSIRDSVERSNLDGKERSTVKRMTHTTFSDIEVFFDVVFATDFDSSLGGKVRLFNKDTGIDDKGWPVFQSTNSEITCVNFYAPQPTITDYCSTNLCESICVSNTTGPVCLCREGFTLNADGRTCTETTGSLHRALVWATSTTICAADVRGIHDGVNYIATNKTCFPNVGSNINWLTVDSHDRTVIFADGSDIYTVTLDGIHTKQRITSATENVTGLAVDWGDKNVYWCQGQQSGTGKINAFSQTTRNKQTLISNGLDNPKALTILPLLRTMMWINGRSGSYQINKANVYGTDIQTIVSWKYLSNPLDLTVDLAYQRLYFIDGNSIKSVQFDGTKLTEVGGGVAKSTLPLKLHSYKNHLLVADAGINLDVLSLTDSESKTYTRSFYTLVAVTDISVVDITEQPEESGPCDADNGDCEHICIPLDRNRICQCSFGFVLDNNTETCSSEPLLDNFMYVSDWTHDKVYQISLINNAVNALDSSTVTDPTGVLYNSITKRIIWGDYTSKYIQSANANGTGYSVLNNVGTYRAYPNRLDLDYSTGNIYYTAVGSSVLPTGFTGIGVVAPNGLHRKLISEGVKPMAIAIDPVQGFLFWTDLGTNPAVLKRAHTDGNNIVTLFASMVWPNGIAIDTSARELYVTDGKTDIIYRCGYEANTCYQYFRDPGANLMDIKLLGNYLFYTAWNKIYITKLHKSNTNDTSKFANNADLGRLDSISLYSSTFLTKNVQSQCSSNNGRGNCSTFCHPTPNSFTCGCPDGEQLLPDGKTCPSVTETWDNKSHDDKASSSQSMHIGAGVGGTVAIVIIVVVSVIVLRKYANCKLWGRKTQSGERYLQNPPSRQSVSDNGAVILQTHDKNYEKPLSRAENIEDKNENQHSAHVYDEIDPIGDCPTNNAPPPPTDLRHMPHSSEFSVVY